MLETNDNVNSVVDNVTKNEEQQRVEQNGQQGATLGETAQYIMDMKDNKGIPPAVTVGAVEAAEELTKAGKEAGMSDVAVDALVQATFSDHPNDPAPFQEQGEDRGDYITPEEYMVVELPVSEESETVEGAVGEGMEDEEQMAREAVTPADVKETEKIIGLKVALELEADSFDKVVVNVTLFRLQNDRYPLGMAELLAWGESQEKWEIFLKEHATALEAEQEKVAETSLADASAQSLQESEGVGKPIEEVIAEAKAEEVLKREQEEQLKPVGVTTTEVQNSYGVISDNAVADEEDEEESDDGGVLVFKGNSYTDYLKQQVNAEVGRVSKPEPQQRVDVQPKKEEEKRDKEKPKETRPAEYGIKRSSDLPWGPKKEKVLKALRKVGAFGPGTAAGSTKIADAGGVTSRDVRHYCYHAQTANLTGVCTIEGGKGYGYYITEEGLKELAAHEQVVVLSK